MRFNLNSPVWRFLSTLVDFTALNIVFLVTCLPMVTIGSASAALYSTIFAYAEHDDIRLVREYLKRFKREFVHGLVSWLIYMVFIAAFTFAVVFYVSAPSTNLGYVIFPLLIVGAITIVGSFEFFYAIQARFANTIRRNFTLALSLSWKLLGYSVVFIGIDITFATLVWLMGMFRVIAFVFGFAWLFYAKGLIFIHIFKRYERVASHPEDPRPTNAFGQ